MANCNNLFSEYNRSIRLTNERRVTLREKRNDLRKRINGCSSWGGKTRREFLI